MSRMRPEPVSIGKLLLEARTQLAMARVGTSGAETSPREASTLLAFVLGLDEARLITRDQDRVASAEVEHFRRLVRRRVAGEPVAYLTGTKGFYGRDFKVDERVLIPRPETEHLVEAALALDLPDAPRIVDIGTGSGAIAVTLACERADAEVIATDLDAGALLLARENARSLGVEDRVHFLRGDLASGLRLGEIDLLVSNPPYIATGIGTKISREVLEFEPHLALFAPGRGRGLIRRLLASAEALRPGTHTLIEIGYDQGEWLRRSVENSEYLELVELVRDYGGHERTAVLRTR